MTPLVTTMTTRPYLGRAFCCWRAEDCEEQSVQTGLHDPPRSTKDTDGNCKVSIDFAQTKIRDSADWDGVEISSPATSYGTCIFDLDDQGCSETDRYQAFDTLKPHYCQPVP